MSFESQTSSYMIKLCNITNKLYKHKHTFRAEVCVVWGLCERINIKDNVLMH